jgi:hypothetical protein
MLKTFAFAGLIAATMIGASSLPASAAQSSSDCAFYAQRLSEGSGYMSRNGNYNWYAVQLQQCR